MPINIAPTKAQPTEVEITGVATTADHLSSNHLSPNRLSAEQKQRVLVVDDDEQNRVLLRFVLQSFGLGVVEANDGQQAIDIAVRDIPDVILMDLSMPVMDGFEATRQLKKIASTSHIPVIAVSAFCDDPAKHQMALGAGCIDCVEKPIRLDKVKAALQAV